MIGLQVISRFGGRYLQQGSSLKEVTAFMPERGIDIQEHVYVCAASCRFVKTFARWVVRHCCHALVARVGDKPGSLVAPVGSPTMGQN